MPPADWYYQSGEGLNLLARAAAVKAPTVAGTLDPQFPVANLYDGRPSKYTRWSSKGAWDGVLFDLNLLPGGDGEDAAALAAWSISQDTAAGVVTQSNTSPIYSGSFSIRLQLSAGISGNHFVSASRDVRFRAGEKLRIYYAGLRVTANNNVTIAVLNLETNLYLQPDATWNATPAVLATYSSTSWGDGYLNFVVPGVEAGGAMWQRLRVILKGSVTSGTTIDVRTEAKIVPGWDTFVALGHAFTPGCVLAAGYQALSGNNPGDAYSSATYVSDWLKAVASSPDVIPAAELYQAGVWNKAQATRYERWLYLFVSQATAPNTPISQVGEIIVCQAETLPVRPRLQLTGGLEAGGQIRMESGAGDVWAYNRTPNQRSRVRLRYQTTSPMSTGVDAAARACRYLHVLRTQGGAKPTLILPYSHDPGLVVYGHGGQNLSVDHQPPERLFEIEVVDLPIPGLHHGLYPA